MKLSTAINSRLLPVLLVALCIWSLLVWQHFNGGVPSHHLLHRSDLPAISNWWGGLLLPLLTWWTLARIAARQPAVSQRGVLAGFAAALLFGIALATSFMLGLHHITEWMPPALLLIALFFPVYRVECLLGFVLGMSYTFGAVLPTGFALVISLLAFVIYNFIRPVPLYFYRRFFAKRH